MSASFPLSAGRTDEYYTPPEIFEALGCTFDLDPCQPETGRAYLSVPTEHFYTKQENGLLQPWHGFVWLNAPFGGRNGVVPWLERFVSHGNGIALVNALTSCGWFHDFAPKMDALFFPRGKTQFVKPDGERGKSPQNGIVLMALGGRGFRALKQAQASGFGLMVTPWNTRAGDAP